jgi:hypothetical protein
MWRLDRYWRGVRADGVDPNGAPGLPDLNVATKLGM